MLASFLPVSTIIFAAEFAAENADEGQREVKPITDQQLADEQKLRESAQHKSIQLLQR